MATVICGKPAGGIGFGLLSLTWRGAPLDLEAAILVLKAALNAGCNVWNGGDFYGTPSYNSLTILREYFTRYPSDAAKVILNIKGGVTLPNFKIDGRGPAVTAAALSCVDTLGPVGHIDMWECARRDRNVPVEETVTALAALARDGKIGGVALSEVNATTIRQAAQATKIAAVEVELSLWATDPLRNGVTQACAELGIPIMAYSPIGRGFLAGTIKSIDDLPEGDVRRSLPRFQPGNFEKNVELVRAVQKIAERKGCTAGQIAINWVRCLSRQPGMPTIVPIPGTSSVERVVENAKIVDLTEEDMAEIQALLDGFDVVGDRYPAAFASYCDA